MRNAITGLMILCFFLCSSCSSKKEKVVLSPEDQADSIRASLRIIGIKSEVTAQDVDGNGGVDFYILVTNLSKELRESRRHLFLAYVTGAVSTIEDREWEGDKAYLELKEGLYKAAISDCAACLLLDKDQVDECIDTAWQKVEE